MNSTRPQTDSAEDLLILVDEADQEIGTCAKSACHRGTGRLHRAFSVFLFNPEGQLLLQQRSRYKPLWPLYWSNSCCSHPRHGESVPDAAHRRVCEELGVDCEIEFLYKFQYQAMFGDIGAEHEVCWVFCGRLFGEVTPDEAEIADWRYLAPAALTAEMAADGNHFTPWIKLEWERLCRDFPDHLG